ncbi:hypothetical protein CMO96_00115 [Candidatus Woesebacteria bacterium]|nr:hypothetical protein [Candidatus Woesebacteria bacterium]
MINYGTRWGSHTSISLEGQLTGRNYKELMNLEDQLISRFSQDFKNFIIVEDSQVIFRRNQCKVESIDFEEGTHARLANYSVKLSSFNAEMFSGFFGVKSPVNTFSFSDNRDGTVSMSHSVSAQGFNTADDPNPYTHPDNTNAFLNALSFVRSLTGWNNQVMPMQLPMASKPILMSYSEKSNELEGTYGVDENWMYNTMPHGGGAPNALIWPNIKDAVQAGGGIENAVNITYSFPNGAKAIIDGQNCETITTQSAAGFATDIAAGFSDISELFLEALGVTVNFESLGVEPSFSANIPLVEDPHYAPWSRMDECLESIGALNTESNSTDDPYVYDLSEAGVGDMRISISTGESPEGAHANFPVGLRLGTSGNVAGDMFFGTNFVLDSEFSETIPNLHWNPSNFKFVFVHEAMHALGMEHSYNDIREDVMTYADLYTMGLFNYAEILPDGLLTPTMIGKMKGAYGGRPTVERPITTTSTSISSGIDQDFVTVDLEYTLRGGRSLGVDYLKSYLTGHTNLWRVATGESSMTGLNYFPISYSVQENAQANSLTVSATYDDDDIWASGMVLGGYLYPVYFDYSASFEQDNWITTTTIEGNLKSKTRLLAQKNYQMEAFLDNINVSGFLYEKAEEMYRWMFAVDSPSWSFNPTPQNVSVTKDESLGQVSLSASFDNSDWIGGLKNASYNFSISPYMSVYKPHPSFNDNGYYLIQDMNTFTPETVEFNINATYGRSGDYYQDRYSMDSDIRKAKDKVRGIYDKLRSSYLHNLATLESENLDFGNGQNSIGFRMSFTQPPYTEGFTEQYGNQFIRAIVYGRGWMQM